MPALQVIVGWSKAIEVRVDVRGAKELVLVTDFGPAGGVGGDVNWADAGSSSEVDKAPGCAAGGINIILD